MHSFALSCYSATLAQVFPTISNMTSIIPHFVQEEHCEGMCNPGTVSNNQLVTPLIENKILDAEGIYKGWKSTKKGYKYKKSIVLAENAHLTLVCPEYV